MKCIRGTFHVAVDTNFIFNGNFLIEYKSHLLKYIRGSQNLTDCVIACVSHDVEDTYKVITELISVFSFAQDCAFIPVLSGKDSYTGDINLRGPGVSRTRMLNYDLRQLGSLDNSNIVLNCPLIETDNKSQSDLVRLFRKARAAEYFDYMISFLLYYHLVDYPYHNSSEKNKNIAEKYINIFIEQEQPELILNLITEINEDRVFLRKEKISKANNATNFPSYIREVRNSVAHIIREPSKNIESLNIDTFKQSQHFRDLSELMKIIARKKLMSEHGFDKVCGPDVLRVIPKDSIA